MDACGTWRTVGTFGGRCECGAERLPTWIDCPACVDRGGYLVRFEGRMYTTHPNAPKDRRGWHP